MKLHRMEREVQGDRDFGSLNGTSSVVLVPSPDPGFWRVVETIRIANVDTAKHTIRIRLTDTTGPTDYEFDSATNLPKDGKFDPVQEGVDIIRLGQNEQVTAVMDEAAVTTDPTWVSSWRDEPDPAYCEGAPA